MKKPAAAERKALGTFLSSRRARLQPADLGLPTGQRRTPGLRREEVAVLAGISVSWYTWLEQGRDINVSTATLERLARVLRLKQAEAEHLLALSSRRPAISGTGDDPSDGLLDLIQAIEPVPAYLRSDRLDILAWNRAAAEIFVDYGTLEPRARNTLYLMFLYAPYRELIHDWEGIARSTIGLFRAARAKTADKAPFDELVEEISAGSEEFRLWWQELDVRGFHEGVKRLNHPTRGRIDLTCVALVPEGRPDLSLVSYLPSLGEGTDGHRIRRSLLRSYPPPYLEASGPPGQHVNVDWENDHEHPTVEQGAAARQGRVQRLLSLQVRAGSGHRSQERT